MEAVFRLPLEIELKPSRRVRRLLLALLVGTVFSLVLAEMPLWPSAALVCVLSASLWQAWRLHARGARLTLLPDAQWIAPGERDASPLGPGSVDLLGVLWLHGVRPDGRRCALMVCPDMPVHPEGWRWLCLWFRNAPNARPDAA